MNGITKPPPPSGDHLGPKIPKYFNKILSTRIIHTSGIVFEIVRKIIQKIILTMSPYRDEYTESESDIQNNNLLYKIHQQCQTTFESL